MFRVWYSTEDLADWLIENTDLSKMDHTKAKLAESDASKPREFHRMPGHLKSILYLDSPDLIVELNGDPIVAIEVTREAGTGHNVFQRFARIAAAVENRVPAMYIYPKAVYISRISGARWDLINPNVYLALERLMRIYNIPALLYHYPSEYSEENPGPPREMGSKGLLSDPAHPSAPRSDHEEMQSFFEAVNRIVELSLGSERRPSIPLINDRVFADRRDAMQRAYGERVGSSQQWFPDTSILEVDTDALLRYLREYAGRGYDFGDMLTSRDRTVIYHVNARFRGDPYPGVLSAVDYLYTRIGPTYEDRDKNLVMAWGNVHYNDRSGEITITSDKGMSANDFLSTVSSVRSRGKCLLGIRDYETLRRIKSIPRYYMQVRYGCTFTKVKHIRVYSFFADAILFPDGAFWREG